MLNASGGVGVFAVQLARVLYDAEVVGTTGPNNLNFVRVSGEFVSLSLTAAKVVLGIGSNVHTVSIHLPSQA